MKKNDLFGLMMLAALTLMWGCSSSDDNNDDDVTPAQTALRWTKTQGAPNWEIDWSGNDSPPQWTAPSPEKYETWMILMVTLQPELVPYCTDDDLMAAFIDNELRALTGPGVKVGTNTKKVSFILKIMGNETADVKVNMTLKYYCSKLKQTFTITGNELFLPEQVYGVDQDYIPNLLKGCPRYPVQMQLSLLFPQPMPKELQPNAADIIAVMVGSDCRAMTTVGENLLASPVNLMVSAKQEGEKGTIYYFSARENAVWNTGVTVDITSAAQHLMMKY
ncbi:MAG: hypothetical protein J6Y23_12200 [Prevotella sp.]|nr:hypothetical protein [Prevotella sp.]